jgi:hypothetical protein
MPTCPTRSLLMIRNFHIGKIRVVRLALICFAGLVLGMWVARAPTSFTGEIPIVGKYFPLKLTAVYVIVVGPIIMVLVSAYLLMQAKWLAKQPISIPIIWLDKRTQGRRHLGFHYPSIAVHSFLYPVF